MIDKFGGGEGTGNELSPGLSENDQETYHIENA